MKKNFVAVVVVGNLPKTIVVVEAVVVGKNEEEHCIVAVAVAVAVVDEH